MTAIKPEIYISWIPRGNINVKTQIFASIIPSEKVFTQTKAATNRRVANFERTTANTLRKVGNAENFQADSLRVVKKVETVHGDTSRKLGITAVKGDTCRQVKNICETKADTLRKIGVWEKISAITLRNVKVSEKVFADTLRKFATLETVNADTSRKLIEKISAATVRKIVIPEKFFADTVVRVPHKLNYFVQPVLMKSAGLLADSASASSIVNTFKDCNVTSFSVTLREKTLSDVFEFQAAHDFNINDAINGQLLDYQFNFLVEEIDQKDLVKSFTGMYDVDELLYSKIMLDEEQVTDTDTAISSASNFVTAMAHYLGKTEDIHIQDFEPYNMEPNQNTTYKDFLNDLFGWTSRVPQRQINVFIRGDTLHCIQRGMEESVIDISNFPHSRPSYNKQLLRTMWNHGDYDPSDSREDDDSAIPFSGTIRFGDFWNYTALTYSNGLLISEINTVNNEKIKSSTTVNYTYTSTLNHETNEVEYYMASKTLHSTAIQIGTEVTHISQTVNLGDGEKATVNMDVPQHKKIVSSSSTRYFYEHNNSEYYLYQELETQTKENYEIEVTAEFSSSYEHRFYGFNEKWTLESTEENVRDTFHVPLGNGWYGHSVNLNGASQGSTVSQGKPGNRVSQYTLDKTQSSLSYVAESPTPDDETPQSRESLAPIADVSFPVEDFELIKELTAELEWLNRKIQETVTVEITDKIVGGVPTINHIIDFTERILLDGAEYFLVSNRITLTPKKLVQNLKLIRWYE